MGGWVDGWMGVIKLLIPRCATNRLQLKAEKSSREGIQNVERKLGRSWILSPVSCLLYSCPIRTSRLKLIPLQINLEEVFEQVLDIVGVAHLYCGLP